MGNVFWSLIKQTTTEQQLSRSQQHGQQQQQLSFLDDKSPVNKKQVKQQQLFLASVSKQKPQLFVTVEQRRVGAFV